MKIFFSTIFILLLQLVGGFVALPNQKPMRIVSASTKPVVRLYDLQLLGGAFTTLGGDPHR